MSKIFRLFLTFIFSSLVFGGAYAWALEQSTKDMFSVASKESTLEVDNSDWAFILKRYVTVGPTGINRFDYATVATEDRDRLNRYLSALEKYDPRTLNLNEQRAYWINLYNALTVKVVLDRYPVGSIREIKSGLFTPGPWDLPIAKVMGRSLTLNNIEHDILRGNWREPRIHYAVNCASLGCPNLAGQPYSGKHLDAQLDSAARSFINHSRGVFIENRQVTLSKIYNWYAEDFGDGSPKAILKHLGLYASPGLKTELEGDPTIESYQYDWRINKPGSGFSLSH